MFRYTDDPVADAEAYYNELARLEEQVPVCRECKQPVQEDFLYELIEDKPICAECLDEHHRKETTESLLCDYCGKAIEDEHYYENDDGQVLHEACVYKHFKKDVIVE